ncbi:MarR family winged helix-turn-helix transcriptional regulator [Asticcacaulis sp. BYS171W]|uniref:MarR family winged helix-turn-helix transcriptional regulator n=1 Tax=Asticcacaulis aquaticus TaxID=2984212 RepID=A0ABT5HWQ4_9CAUL|nr:MarR family winged helix-turn-helix transcriptional regulator [Asticcacaulis aquaticus]MDC7684509.1 MarR family winged helix-turn-helix transcriptional regulator [Asticcacaulis aquaticus]
MPNNSLSLDNYLPFRLSVASNAVSTLISSAYDSLYALAIPEWRLIWVLNEDGPSTQREMVQRTGMDKVTVSRAAHSLAKRRLVTRSPHEHDGRSHHLILTPEGQRLFNDVAPSAGEFERQVLEGLTETETALLKDVLRRIETAAIERRRHLEL